MKAWGTPYVEKAEFCLDSVVCGGGNPQNPHNKRVRSQIRQNKGVITATIRDFACFSIYISSIKVQSKLIRHADVALSQWVRWFLGLTRDFWAENDKRKTSRGQRQLNQSFRPSTNSEQALGYVRRRKSAESCIAAIIFAIIYRGSMNSGNRHRVWAWVLCALLFWLTVNPPHCELCDGVSFTVASAQQSILNHSHSVAPDDCNGICSCCGFHCLPNVRQILVRVNVELAGVAPEAPRPALAPRFTIFRPPRIVTS
jgi:hypothetical protein